MKWCFSLMVMALFAAQATGATTLALTRTNAGVALRWQGPGVLQAVADLGAGWAEMPQAVAALTVAATNSMKFFRLRGPTFTVADTGQTNCYGNSNVIAAPLSSQPFYGQDAQFTNSSPAYTNNGDGTITDLNTGLMWVQARGTKLTWDAAVAGAVTNRIGGYADWRMPSIK
ncbi:MAG: DUF1566 domain-containing protein, partial [Verrucomicrobia bacterium]|nr:DUF1566 domain-containing protein [Verrucomicrobiota bacterium]